MRFDGVGSGDGGRGGWHRAAPPSTGRLLVAMAEVFGGLGLLIVAVGALARASDVVLRFLVG